MSSTTLSVWRDQMVRLMQLRVDQIVGVKLEEVDAAMEYTVESLPPGVRRMKFVDYVRNGGKGEVFPVGYVQAKKRRSFCMQTSPKGHKEHQTQTPQYTAVKRSRAEMEGELSAKIRTQLASQSQHIILPNTTEYVEMPAAKKQQIVGILNAIVSTYEGISDDLVANEF